MKKAPSRDGAFLSLRTFKNVVILLLEKQFKRTADFGFVRFDTTAELNLDACAMEVLTVVFCLEINVTGEIVREEAESELIGDEAGCVVDVLFVEIGKQTFAMLLVAVEEGEAEIDVKIDFGEICAFFAGRIAT